MKYGGVQVKWRDGWLATAAGRGARVDGVGSLEKVDQAGVRMRDNPGAQGKNGY